MTKETSVATPHKDILGKDIYIGDFVAISYHNGLKICKVGKSTPKMLRVFPVNTTRAHKGYIKYGTEMVIVDGQDVFIHALST